MEEKTMMPINNQIEPDFLEHIKSTFKRWRDLNTQGVTIGARELSNFAFTLKGASMNSHLGFKYNFNPRGTDADGNPAITLKLYSSWERGTNENTNKLIRRHIPKGEDFDEKQDRDIEFIENWINTYPRGIFGFRTSEELFKEELEKITA